MVKIVLAELKMEVRELIRAASMTANMRPRIPSGKRLRTNKAYEMLEQPPSEPHIRLHSAGSEQATKSGQSTLAAMPGMTSMKKGNSLR